MERHTASVRGLPRVLLFILLEQSWANAHHAFKLIDGHDIPSVALGTSLGHLADGTRVLSANHSLARAVQWALEAGYRHVDTAALYRTEDEVGLGVRDYLRDKGLHRDNVYITTKLWNDAHERDEVIPALKQSLENLQMEYVDLYLMHYPMAYKKNGSISLTDYLETWKGLEDAVEANLTKSIGVSNFNITQMQRLWDNARIKPAVLQIEVNPSITQEELVGWCRTHGVIVMGYSPFGAILGRKPDAPPPKADDPALQRIATQHGKTVPQILLRYLLDRQIVAIPRSTNKERIKQNIDIFDFSLTPEEVAVLLAFNSNYRLRTPAKWYPHPHFPFPKKNLTGSEIEYIIAHSVED
ncbi:aldo-keto reductase AKR2E4-like isoform X1 [Ostrinia furnacalis]|uniref:aldo-keto reductase AKR2E4-like isoform X1 n=1 Tax=Ostrinia furnacalis TaxID=93504 RepID=UPI00103EE849|nr:aldo-keto reductase AKR2E4-like isoform X1 [Ostrinia furnacalis]